MAGTLVISDLSDGTNSTSATNCIQGSAKAWVNFNGTGTVAIRGSYNVSSITDNGTGLYTVNFTNAMPNINYAVNVTGRNPFNGTAGEVLGLIQAPTSTTSVQIRNATTSTSYDTDIACVSVFSL
jgi:hypothetical protein